MVRAYVTVDSCFGSFEPVTGAFLGCGNEYFHTRAGEHLAFIVWGVIIQACYIELIVFALVLTMDLVDTTFTLRCAESTSSSKGFV